VIDGTTTVGADTIIGADAYLFDAILGENVRVGIQARLVDCIVANGAAIGRGARLTAVFVAQPDTAVPAGAIVEGPVRVLPRSESPSP
jgi:NDP-sugar pyrophosphorylase family protein